MCVEQAARGIHQIYRSPASKIYYQLLIILKLNPYEPYRQDGMLQ